jgi:D-amino-acid dehydrogenase
MHVAVLGAGVVGVTTAYLLAEAGHDVTVIDREAGVAHGCSLGNGGQLSYSYTDAMANPAFLARMPLLLSGFDPAIRVRPPVDANLLRWGLDFIRECTPSKARENTLTNLRLALRSKQLIDELRTKIPGDFAYRSAGKIILLRTEKERSNAFAMRDLKAELGVLTRVISVDEATDIEPAIQYMSGDYVGAIYSPGDDVGDAHAFSVAVAAFLHGKPNCQFQLSTSISQIVTSRGRVCAVATDRGPVEVDNVVVCLGSWSAAILKPLGVNVGILPARGYSLTLPPGEHSAMVSITDIGKRFVLSRIGDRVRIAGFADFVGFRTAKDPQRTGKLLEVASHIAPAAADYSSADNMAWGGLRPLTANGRPRVGPTAISGLYLNTGHGSLGWTLACASAETLVDSIVPTRASAKRQVA